MVTDGGHISEYDPGRTGVLLGEAARLLRGLGFAGGHLTFIGGLVPSLLIPELDPGIAPHVGSGDVDLCLSVALTTGEVGAYDRAEKVLKELGYKMKPQGPTSASSWQWVGGVNVTVTVEFFCGMVGPNAAGQLYRPEGDVTKGLSAMTLATGTLIDRDFVEIATKVELPDGAIAEVPFRVTAPAAFIASKSDALARRDKPKDAYDIVWLCEAWPNGVSTLARVITGSPVFSDRTMQEALRRLANQFADIDSLGARSYARFVEPIGSTTLDASARRAAGAVNELLATVNAATPS